MTPNEERILKQTLDFGGYVTTELLSLWRPDIHYRNQTRPLSNLASEKYLIVREEYSIGRASSIYQVTQRTCAYFRRPNSFLRNKKSLPTVHRALIRSYYLFDLLGKGYRAEDVMSHGDEKISYFRNLGIRELALPAKYNSGNRLTQIEEYLLLASPITGEGELTILYINKPASSEWHQLHTVLSKYSVLSQQINCPPLTLLIICEHDHECHAYERAATSSKIKHDMQVRAEKINHIFFPP